MKGASVGDFWAMGGKGLYVWGSYAVTLICLFAEIALVRGRFGGVPNRLGRMKHATDRGVIDET